MRTSRCLKHEYSNAVALTKRALEIDRNVFGPTHPRVGSALSGLASLYQIQGQNEEAERLLRQALEIIKGHPKADVSGTLIVLNSLSSVYLRGNRWTEAEPLLEEGLKYCDSVPRLPQAVRCASFRRLLAEVYRRQGKTFEADQLLSEAVQDAGTSRGSAGEMVTNLNSIGQRYDDEGRYTEAEAAYGRAIAWIEKNRGLEDAAYLPAELDGLGRLLEKQGRNSEAEKLFTRALELQTRAAEAGRPGIVESLNFSSLLDLYRTESRLSEMEPILGRGLEIQERLLGPRHASVADTVLMIAGVYEEEGKYAQAETLYERAIGVQETNWGHDHPKLIGTLSLYVALLRELNENAKAAEVEARIKAIREKQAAPRQRN